MTVLIQDFETIGDSIYIEITAGAKVASVVTNRELGTVRVLCKNASHRAYRGTGRIFPSWDEAIAGYKSAEMREIIETAKHLAG